MVRSRLYSAIGTIRRAGGMVPHADTDGFLSTIDPRTPDGAHIPIEERPDREVTHVGGTRIVPEGVPVFNFAFDVTPADCITGIITEKGVLRAPYGPAIAAALGA